jgi:hypothetical protein
VDEKERSDVQIELSRVATLQQVFYLDGFKILEEEIADRVNRYTRKLIHEAKTPEEVAELRGRIKELTWLLERPETARSDSKDLQTKLDAAQSD